MNAAWRGPILLAAGSALIVAAIQFGAFERNQHPIIGAWLGGFVAGQFTVLAAWASWSPVAAWKRIALVLAYMGIPTYVVLAREWWLGGTTADAMVYYLPDSLLLLVLMAVLTPIRWMFGYRVSNTPRDSATLKAGRFRIAEVLGLTVIVAGALTIMFPGGAGQMETSEFAFGAIMLGVTLAAMVALLFPISRVMLSPRFSLLWLAALLAYLVVAIAAAAEVFQRVIFFFKGPFGFATFWEFRVIAYSVGAGFCMSLLPTLYLLRLVGFRLMIGSAGAVRMTACDTARC
jgi:hypothetical protein